MNIELRASEISEFLKTDYRATFDRLSKGFHFNHALVAEDFIGKKINVNDHNQLLEWYRTSDAYIWELSSYHLDEGFNYSGMCDGIALSLKNINKKNVLSLGDGIGDLSIRISDENLNAFYHDLEDSKTAQFAQFRFNKYGKNIKTIFTNNWDPKFDNDSFDAVVALDFFEHLINVEQWSNAVFNCLKNGGVFIAQNAFAIGDLEHGNSIPMHLSINNKYETEWAPMMRRIGFVLNEDNGWWIKP